MLLYMLIVPAADSTAPVRDKAPGAIVYYAVCVFIFMLRTAIVIRGYL